MKTAMIWGAAGGIGRALTTKLVEQDWNVISVARRAERLSSLTPHTIDGDISSPFDVETAVTTAAQITKKVDLWVYTVGDITAAKTADMHPNDWQRILNANLSGAFLATRFSLPLLAENAHLFYLGAISERLRLPGLGAYAAAKAGLEAFVDALSKEERKRRITIVRPAAVDTPFWDKVPMSLPKNALAAEHVVDKMITAYDEQHSGTLDIKSA